MIIEVLQIRCCGEDDADDPAVEEDADEDPRRQQC